MNFQKYQREAKRTSASMGSDKLDLSHMVLGLHSEYNEFIDAMFKGDDVNSKEELADMIWYVANYATFRNYSLETLVDRNLSSEYHTLPYYTSHLQDLVKKFVAYNKEINRKEEVEILKHILLKIIILFRADDDEEIFKALQNNIDKLYVRFPDDGFSEERAINRDLQSERKELEK